MFIPKNNIVSFSFKRQQNQKKSLLYQIVVLLMNKQFWFFLAVFFSPIQKSPEGTFILIK